jgi:hypothetical protein
MPLIFTIGAGGSGSSSATGSPDDPNKLLEVDTTTEKVKNLGSYLFSSIKGAGQKLKETVSNNTIKLNNQPYFFLTHTVFFVSLLFRTFWIVSNVNTIHS